MFASTSLLDACARGAAILEPYRRTDGKILRRAWIIATDPASWRDVAWLLRQSTIDWALAVSSAGLLLGSSFYLTYPVWFALSPPPVFRESFGPWSHLHSLAQSCALMPVAALCFAIWYATVLPIARVEAVAARRLLSPR